jgi:hypothetical protein
VSQAANTLDLVVAAFHPMQSHWKAWMLDGVVLARRAAPSCAGDHRGQAALYKMMNAANSPAARGAPRTRHELCSRLPIRRAPARTSFVVNPSPKPMIHAATSPIWASTVSSSFLAGRRIPLKNSLECLDVSLAFPFAWLLQCLLAKLGAACD